MIKGIKYVFLVWLLLQGASAYCQLLVSNTMTPQQLVQNVFVGGGVSVSNITYTGSSQAIGRFTTGANPTNLGISTGIIMSSGMVSTAVGPNNSGAAGTSLGTPGDATLNTITAPTLTLDASVLEFDFVPLSDTIKFRFVFGSEEYTEFVNSIFNDVFGFFISGLSPYGGMYTNYNIARIPNSTTPISINNVNHLLNSQYYVNNGSGSTSALNPWIQYDGFTTVLTAWALVFPCLTYHFKLVVADAGDGIYDSGVMLEAYSFSSTSINVSQSFTKPTLDTIAIEGCSDAILTFRIPSAKSTPTAIYYGVAGTATSGVDYVPIPSMITIPVGQDSVNLVISAILDSISEPLEHIMLTVATSPCTYDTVYVYIRDYQPMSLDIGNDTLICDGMVQLPSIINGGLAPYTYTWSNGQTSSMYSDTLSQSTAISLKIADQCQESRDSLMVYVSKPLISVSSDSVCQGEMATLWASATGGVLFNWSNGMLGDTILVAPLLSSQYYVVVTDTLGCSDSAQTMVFVHDLPIPLVSVDTIICDFDTITLWASGGDTYLWSNTELTNTINVSPSASTTYAVTLTNTSGCIAMAEVHVDVISIPDPEIFSPRDTLCRGESVELMASGGDLYTWSTGAIFPTIAVKPSVPTQYTVTVSNELNNTRCFRTSQKFIYVSRCFSMAFPNAFIPGSASNGLFGPIGEFSYLESFEMCVYDRWGRLIFKSTSPYEHWNGTRQNGGELLPLGVFTYIAKVKEYMEAPLILTGTVHLLR